MFKRPPLAAELTSPPLAPPVAAALSDCPRCGGFVPAGAADCPLCASLTGGPLGRVARAALTVAGCTGLAVTLAACYGGPCGGSICRPIGPPPPATGQGGCAEPAADADGDGYCGQADCDEGDPSIHAGADDPLGDGIDQSCDGRDG